MWTKGALVSEALAELSIGDTEFDISPDEQVRALRRLDAMMAAWEAKGVRVGYAMPSDPDGSSMADQAGIPDTAAAAVFLGLAIALAPGYGKAISPDTKTAARNGYDALLLGAAYPQQQQYRGSLPAGAGNRRWLAQQRTFLPSPDNTVLDTTQGGALNIIPE